MRIGILGGGQLARMMAIAGYPLGQHFTVLDPAGDVCAGALCRHLVAEYDDESALSELADQCDLVTLDFENVPVSAVEFLQGQVSVMPGAAALRAAQDRVAEKDLFTSLAVPVPPYRSVDSLEDLEQAIEAIGLPARLKTRRMGYDGKGQVQIDSAGQVAQAWQKLGPQPLVLEGFVKFRRELSLIAARSTRGETVFYPLIENRHKDGILVTSFAPAIADALTPAARQYATSILDALDYVGVLTVEFFDLGGELLANEMAPRVHNSGHWTIDGAVTSQFENHLRAIMGWPLGATDPVGASAMLNWIGAMPDPSSALSYPNAHWHDYGKRPRAGRKVGHVTICADNILALQAELGRFALALGEQLKDSGAASFIGSTVQ